MTTLRLAFSPILLLCALSLTGCGGETGGGTVRSASTRPAPAPVGLAAVRPPVRQTPAAPAIQVAPGLEGVVGATSADLVRQFGPARLEVWEGDARKLQFTGTACVLDVYLYPASQGREPQATYVDARRASDGRDTDRAACVSALRQR